MIKTLKDKLTASGKISGAIALIIAIIIFVIAIRTAILGTVVYFLWNGLVIKWFSVSAMSWAQSWVVGLILAIFLPSGGSSKKD